MNWFQAIANFLNAGNAIASLYIKNTESKQTQAQVTNVISTVLPIIATIVEGLANNNPDGSPASLPYNGPTATVKNEGVK